MTPDEPPPLSDHKRSFSGICSRYAPHLLMWGIFLVIGLGLLILGLARPTSGTVLPGALFLAGSFLWLAPLFIGLARTPRQAKVTSGGLSWQDKRGEHTCTWAAVAAVYRLERIVNQTFKIKELRVVQTGGDEVKFHQCLESYDRLADAVHAAASRQLLPAKRNLLATTGAEFGTVTPHRDGITLGTKKISWPEIEQYTIFNGSLVVYPRGYKGIRCEEVSLSDVPNYSVLLVLLQELGQRPVPPQQSILFTGRK